ncbi:MAG: exopolysaccharide biosynthesis polyprenyl glycosylphosphotransferase [Firmicutes bacterium]|nr:exopolysaccharide biosynthesis polyprenyl glycosylphosphotransferase [Bacillota bacterium]
MYMLSAIKKAILITGNIIIIIITLNVYLKLYEFDYFSAVTDDRLDRYDIFSWGIVIASWMLVRINGLLHLIQFKIYHLLISIAAVALELLLVVILLHKIVLGTWIYFKIIIYASLVQLFVAFCWNYAFQYVEKSIVSLRNVLIIGKKESYSIIKDNIVKLFPDKVTIEFLDTRYLKGDLEKSDFEKYKIILVLQNIDAELKKKFLNISCQLKSEVIIMADEQDIIYSCAKLDKFGDSPVFQIKSFKLSFENRAIKRILDIIISIVSLLMLSPILLFIIIIVKISSPGPVIYKQVRCGINEELFTIYKIRTMVLDAEKQTGAVMCTVSDARVTSVGKYLRQLRLDEIPQLINVLKGEMSIVGPRPERPEFVEKYNKELPYYSLRHKVKPGITGVAQVKGRYNTTVYSKLLFDLLYIQNCSPLTDLAIILETLKVLLNKESTAGVAISEALNCEK